MGKPIIGIGKQSNLDKLANYAKKDSYGDNDRQGKSQLDSRDKRYEASDGPTSVRTRGTLGHVESNCPRNGRLRESSLPLIYVRVHQRQVAWCERANMAKAGVDLGENG